jgi:hypothetical protein
MTNPQTPLQAPIQISRLGRLGKARQKLIISSNKFFDLYVARDWKVLSQTLRGRYTLCRHETALLRSAFLEGREIEPLEQAGGQCRGPILSTDPASPAGLFVPVARTRPSIALCYPHLRGPLVSSYSPPPFVGSPPRCVFDPLRSWRRIES